MNVTLKQQKNNIFSLVTMSTLTRIRTKRAIQGKKKTVILLSNPTPLLLYKLPSFIKYYHLSNPNLFLISSVFIPSTPSYQKP